MRDLFKRLFFVKKNFCRPCFNARSCGKCGAVNQAGDAAACPECLVERASLGAAQTRLAMWCLPCTSHEQRASELCEVCWQKKVKLDEALGSKCHHCGKPDSVTARVFQCDEHDCQTRMRFCVKCISIGETANKVQCKSCWHAAGDICIRCGINARRSLHCLRCCRVCVSIFFLPEM